MSPSTLSTSGYGHDSMKTCTKCRIEQPKESFRPYSGRSVDGRRPMCKRCQRAYEREWRKKNKARLAQARERRREKERLYRIEYNARRRGYCLVQGARLRALRKGLPFDLDQHIEAVEARVQLHRCELTGLPLILGAKRGSWNSPSIDRIDPGKGYVYSNIRIVCFAMNVAMGKWGESVLRKVMTAWLGGG